MSIIGFPFSMRWPQAVMYQSRSPQLMIFDSCSVHVLKMLDAHALARYNIVGLWPALPRPVMGTSRLSRSKRKFMKTHQNLAVKHLVFPKPSLFYATRGPHLHPAGLRSLKWESKSSVKLPINLHMMISMRERLWVNQFWNKKGAENMMTYIWCMWGMEIMARCSEYTLHEPGRSDHCIRVGTYLLCWLILYW